MARDQSKELMNGISGTDHGTRLLYALNAASAKLQRSARSEADVFTAVKELIAEIELRGGVSQLDETGTHLTVRTVVLPNRASERLERLTGFKMEGYEFDIDKVDTYREVVKTGTTLFIPDSSKVSLQLIPERVRGISRKIMKFLGSPPGIYAPIIYEGEVKGVLNVVGESLSLQDVPAMEAFANHIAIALENARLFSAMQAEIAERKQAEETSLQMEIDLHQRANQLSVLHALSLDITTLVDFPTLLNKIIERATQLLSSKGGALYVCDSENEEVRLLVERYLGGKEFVGIVLKFGEGAAGRVGQTGEPLIIDDYQSWSGRNNNSDTRPIYTAVLSVPMVWQGKVIGVLQVLDGMNRRFDQSDQQLLTLFANQAAIAFENAHLFEKAATERRHLQLLYDISQELAASLDVDEMLDRATSLTCQALGGSMGQAFLYMPEEDVLKLRVLYKQSEPLTTGRVTEINVGLGQGLAGWVAQHLESALVPDVAREARWLYVPEVDQDVCSAISAPIAVGGQLLGVITVLHSKTDAFTEDQVSLLRAICHEISLALSNAQRYQQVERRLNESTLIQSLAQVFNQRLDVQNLLDEVVIQLVRRLNYPRVAIYLVDGERLELRAHYGVQPNVMQALVSDGALGSVARTGEPILIVNQDRTSNHEQSVDILAVPILQGKIVVGVIYIDSSIRGQLSAQDRDLLQVLAGQVSIALENAVLYEHIRRHAAELEHNITQRTAELAELYELSQRIGYTLSYDDLLRMMINHLRNAIGGELAAGGLYYEDKKLQYVETTRALSSAGMSALRAYWLDTLEQQHSTPSDWEKLAVEVVSCEGFVEYAAPISQIGMLIHSPILIGGELIGVLIAGFEHKDGIGTAQERLLNTFAHQTAAAVQRLAAMRAEERKRLESLVEHLPVGVLLLDEDHKLLLANPPGKAFLSVLNGGSLDGRLLTLGSQRIADLIARHSELIPVEIASEGIPRRIFEAQARSVESEQHQWVLTLREVTHEREYHAQIQMQERLATVGQLAAGIAHDFNYIMAAILVYTDLLRSDLELSSVANNQLGIIQQQVHRASSLIRQILDFSRRSVMEPNSFDLLPFVKEMEKMLRRVIPENINLRLSYQPGTYMVKADPSRLQQALMNLAVNARDAMPDGGVLLFEVARIEVKSGETTPISDMQCGSWVRVTVSDTGVGIPPDHLAHIFEPFFTTKPVGQGTGLGLAQVYGIIKQHDGLINVESQSGTGTKFNIYLPAQDTAKVTSPIREVPIKLDGAGKCVLVVEDDQATLIAIQTLLEAHNYHVLTASNGIEALQRYERDMGSVKLVVSDLVMPQMGGLALFRKISECWPEAKMLFVTGHPMEGDSQNLLEKGNVSWLQKPFSIQQFNQAVRTLLESDGGIVH